MVQALDFLIYLRVLPAKRRGGVTDIALVADRGVQVSAGLSAANHKSHMVAVSCFYDWAILSDQLEAHEVERHCGIAKRIEGLLADLGEPLTNLSRCGRDL